ncbi:MAG: glutamate--cysteine ligase [Actinomyces urogenitalis]|uniref:glutamate--cysteine ligase n=1 Tax=Actinomyces urogenitalis TaxID=103621 RepID=UPI00242F1E9E|nr:glutamate--cysteine ligase [Actinomyces urogenitalis]MBS5977156.1 glutamate--cysteine ligase [Actinomyces urogenitalis]
MTTAPRFRHHHRQELSFASSPRSGVGIEWELQLLDRDSLDLRQCAAEILGAVGQDPNIHGEMMLNTIELVSGARHTIAECVEDIAFAYDRLLPVVDPLRVDLVSAGTHPFADPLVQRVTDAERYSRLVDRTRLWGHQMLIFGTHVHVGLEDRDKALPILKALLTRTAHLQCLSASSPFWAGEATGYADNRAMMFQQLPTAGAPHQLDTWADLEAYAGDMIHTGVIEEFSEVRWDVRPSPRLGTIEVRACDAATNLTELASIAALTQCLVESFSRALDRGEELDAMPDWYVDENKWRSARYGMDAILITGSDGEEELVSDTVAQMVEQLMPVAEELGCVRELVAIQITLDAGASYQRQLAAVSAAGGANQAAVKLMQAEVRAGRPLSPTEVLSTASTIHPSTLPASHRHRFASA